MAISFTERDLVAELVKDLASALEAMAGGPVTVTPTAATAGGGWSTAVTATGVRQGTFAFWMDRAGAAAIGRLIIGTEEAPDNSAVVDALREMWSQAASALCQTPRFSGVKLTVAGPVAAEAPAEQSHQFTLALASLGTAQVSVSGTFIVDPATTGDRANLDLVLDIELPLTVRFGRAIMSLQALADLGPGSVVDMGRSPDDPVELLISDRVFAKGEVVVVGGNYGVRVTDLVGTLNKPRSGELT